MKKVYILSNKEIIDAIISYIILIEKTNDIDLFAFPNFSPSLPDEIEVKLTLIEELKEGEK